MLTSVQDHCQRMASQVHDFLESLPPGLASNVIVGVVVGGAVLYVTVRYLRYRHSRSVVWERGQEAARAIQNLTNHLMQEEQEEGPADREKEAKIVTLTLRQLSEKLRKGDLTAKEVLRAFQRKALEVNKKLNCITEPIFEAEAMAVERDLRAPNQRGPLHGVPISVKDSFFLEGYDCHAGMSVFVDQPKEQDAHLVELMKKLGAIPFVRTNFPQGLMTYACSNPMYGETHNPHDTTRGPGGSSGGEGALIGGGGSVVGLGSDIGGSIRIPCQMCGVYGLKPTVDRIVNKGSVPIGEGQTLVRVTGGLMTRDMDSLLLLSEETFTPIMHQLDPVVPPLCFRDELFSSKGPLCVGVYTAIEGIKPHPACVRAVNEAKAALERRGYKIVEFKPPRPVDAISSLFMKSCFADAGEDSDCYLKDDVLDYSVRFSYYAGGLPYWLQILVGHLMRLADPVLGSFVLGAARVPKKIIDWWRLEKDIQAYKAEFLAEWRKKKLHALICPGLPFPAVTSGQEDNTLSGVVYTTLYNLLDYPAGIMPVTTVSEDDLRQLRDPAIFPQDTALAKFLVKDSKGSEGLPVSVQCVSLPFQEELVLRVMRDIDTTLKQ